MRAATSLALVAAAACSASSKKSLDTFGQWIASDSKRFASDIRSVPDYVAGHTRSQMNDMGGSVDWFGASIGRDARTTAANVTGVPAWIANEWNWNLHNLRSGASTGGLWISSDTNRFVNEDILGAPAYVGRQFSSQMKDLGGSLSGFGRMIDTDASSFWDRMTLFFELLLFQ